MGRRGRAGRGRRLVRGEQLREVELRSRVAPATRHQAPWDPKASTYGLLTGRITDRLVDPLLDAAAVTRGMRVLDVGTGPGYAARRASELGAVATGVDIAEHCSRSRAGAIRGSA